MNNRLFDFFNDKEKSIPFDPQFSPDNIFFCDDESEEICMQNDDVVDCCDETIDRDFLINLRNIAITESRVARSPLNDANQAWQRTFEKLADAADALDAMFAREESRERM